jgi:hypothetical protein
MGHPLVDEPHALPGAVVAHVGQASFVRPSRDGRVVLLRHEQGEREAAQDTLRRAAPPVEPVGYVDQLTGEGQRVRLQAQVAAQLRPDVQVAERQVVAPAGEALQLGADPGATLLQVVALTGERRDPVTELAAGARQPRPLRPDPRG